MGGKNANLGEMYRNLTNKGVRVPNGFALTTDAFRAFLGGAGLTQRISQALASPALATDHHALATTAAAIRGWVMESELPEDINQVSSPLTPHHLPSE